MRVFSHSSPAGKAGNDAPLRLGIHHRILVPAPAPIGIRQDGGNERGHEAGAVLGDSG